MMRAQREAGTRHALDRTRASLPTSARTAPVRAIVAAPCAAKVEHDLRLQAEYWHAYEQMPLAIPASAVALLAVAEPLAVTECMPSSIDEQCEPASAATLSDDGSSAQARASAQPTAPLLDASVQVPELATPAHAARVHGSPALTPYKRFRGLVRSASRLQGRELTALVRKEHTRVAALSAAINAYDEYGRLWLEALAQPHAHGEPSAPSCHMRVAQSLACSLQAALQGGTSGGYSARRAIEDVLEDALDLPDAHWPVWPSAATAVELAPDGQSAFSSPAANGASAQDRAQLTHLMAMCAAADTVARRLNQALASDELAEIEDALLSAHAAECALQPLALAGGALPLESLGRLANARATADDWTLALKMRASVEAGGRHRTPCMPRASVPSNCERVGTVAVVGHESPAAAWPLGLEGLASFESECDHLLAWPDC